VDERGRFVAHFDILGWKHAIRRDFDRAWSVFGGFAEAHDRVHGTLLEVGGIVRPSRVVSRVFSDTLLLYTPSDDDIDLHEILIRSGELFKDQLHRWVPIRGGIAHGAFRDDEQRNLFAGEALIEAYEMGERAQWLGVVLSDSVAAKASLLRPTFGSDQLDPGVVEWDVPLRCGDSRRSWVLNWPPVFRRNFTEFIPTTGPEMHRFVHPIFGPWEELREYDQAKYANTARFIAEQMRAMDRRARELVGSPDAAGKPARSRKTGPAQTEPLGRKNAAVAREERAARKKRATRKEGGQAVKTSLTKKSTP
jgi:hypothetical protein